MYNNAIDRVRDEKIGLELEIQQTYLETISKYLNDFMNTQDASAKDKLAIKQFINELPSLQVSTIIKLKAGESLTLKGLSLISGINQNNYKNLQLGYDCITASANQGVCANAQWLKGLIYSDSAKKYKTRAEYYNKTAYVYYQMAANQNHCAAGYSLGYCYEHGIGVKLNLANAIAYYKFAATRGLTISQYALAACYCNDPEKLSEAVAWFLKAAKQGYPKAYYCLGICFEMGMGVPSDFQIAAHHYYQSYFGMTDNIKKEIIVFLQQHNRIFLAQIQKSENANNKIDDANDSELPLISKHDLHDSQTQKSESLAKENTKNSDTQSKPTESANKIYSSTAGKRTFSAAMGNTNTSNKKPKLIKQNATLTSEQVENQRSYTKS